MQTYIKINILTNKARMQVNVSDWVFIIIQLTSLNIN